LSAAIFYNQYFGTSRFNGRSYYGGHFSNNNDNHYQLFSANGIDFLVISPEYDQTTGFSAAGGVLDWAENLVKTYPNRKVIVMSHFVLNGDATFSVQGKAIYNRFKVYPNFILMIGGHIAAYTGEGRRNDTYKGNTVETIASDYQYRPNGGDGALRIYEFDPSINTIAAQTYSPFTNRYENDSSSLFNFSVNLNSNPFTLIGQATEVASGTNACVNWSSLEANAEYEWYAEVSDGENTITGPVMSFTTTINTSRVIQPAISSRLDLEKINIKIGPNPSHNTLSVYIKGLSRNTDLKISVLSIVGSVLTTTQYSSSHNPFTLNVSQLKSGTYILQVATGGTKVFRKFIKE
jgi:hypothetical protein